MKRLTCDSNAASANPHGENGASACWWFGLRCKDLLPFRHFLYPGDVDWTEEGSRFAWRMMLVDKPAAMQFLARDPGKPAGGFRSIPSRGSRRNNSNGSAQYPGMAHQFSRFLAEELKRKGYGDLEIRVIDLCSMNGRKPQLLIDPQVDLAAEPETWGTNLDRAPTRTAPGGTLYRSAVPVGQIPRPPQTSPAEITRKTFARRLLVDFSPAI